MAGPECVNKMIGYQSMYLQILSWVACFANYLIYGEWYQHSELHFLCQKYSQLLSVNLVDSDRVNISRIKQATAAIFVEAVQ